MTKDDILQALRLTAMGRAGHPLQEELADKLAGLFAPAAPIEPPPPVEAPEVVTIDEEVRVVRRARREKAD